MGKIKLLILAGINVFIGIFIYDKFRILLYRILMGYDISFKAHLGQFPIIIADKVRIAEGARIGHMAKIMDCKKVCMARNSHVYRKVFIMGLSSFYLGQGSRIGVECRIFSRHRDRQLTGAINGGRFIVGNRVILNNRNIFDVSGNILFKENVVLGASGSMFYTHSYDCYRNFSYGDIIICRDVYIGAGTIFLPGVRIASECVIGAGSVVSRSAPEKGVYAGCPIKKLSDDPRSHGLLIKKY